jgi:diguanylate cyclase (GGDEF)-like protein
MLQDVADAITDNIEEITRRWVDELRQSPRTEVHKQLLTAEIVNGMKGMLANLAESIAAREMPGDENSPILTLPRLYKNSTDDTPAPRPRGTAPLSSPFARAQHAASSHGIHRHNQNCEIHEVIIEYVKLRQIIWEMVGDSLRPDSTGEMVEVTQYVNMLLDELLLSSLEHFYSASVRDLEKRALRDPLTQLYNKDYFTQRLGGELRRAVRSGYPLTVAMLDMDRLKEINDTYGHQAGDSVIVAVAAAIRDTCRRSDIPCRYGGDEFAVILPETGKLQGRVFAERVMRSLRNLTVVISPREGPKRASDFASTGSLDSSKLPLIAPVPTVSVGLATFPEDARNPETLLAQSDAALYRAKNEGRDRIAY